jgi:SAM-dependent methyltransferase
MWFIFLLVIILCFGFVILFGAPYLPIHNAQAKQAIDLANLDRDKTFYELGCGDGKMLLLAQKSGARVVGIELNPLLFLVAWARCLAYKNIDVIWGSFWRKSIHEADVVYVFLIDRFMKKLDQKMIKESKDGAILISYTFKIPDKKPIKIKSGLFMYRY